MDVTPIIAQFQNVLCYLIPLAILAALIKSPWFKGVVGELMVNVAARLFLNKNQYHLIKNVTLPTEDGTTQIDHIIVSRFGIFVIETKNMRGWIFGNPGQKIWTQKIYKHSIKFQNPLHQNYKHVKTLEASLGIDSKQIHSVVVFVGDSTFKTEMPDNVTYARGFIRFIKSKTEVVFSDSEVQNIIDGIESGRLSRSIKTHVSHVKHVKFIINEKQALPLCPKCGSTMILRETKNGVNAGKTFWGCSRFPACRGIISIKPSGEAMVAD